MTLFSFLIHFVLDPWVSVGCCGFVTAFCSWFDIPSNRNLLTSGLYSGSSWSDGVNGILMQQEPNLPKQDYWNRRAIASLANTLITVVEPVPMPLLSSMLLLQL
jgi:hypothetical protein